MAKTYDFLFKLLLIGDRDVGKTCILDRFTGDYFNSSFIPTHGKGHDEVAGLLLYIIIIIVITYAHVCVHESSTFKILLFIFLGIDYRIRTVDIDGKKIKLQMWDTTGREQRRDMTTVYYRGANVSCGYGEDVVRFVILELFI